MTKEEVLRVNCFHEALYQLRLKNSKWASNYLKYDRWDAPMQLWYIKQIEKQAAKGTVMAQEMIAAAMAVRMRM